MGLYKSSCTVCGMFNVTMRFKCKSHAGLATPRCASVHLRSEICDFSIFLSASLSRLHLLRAPHQIALKRRTAAQVCICGRDSYPIAFASRLGIDSKSIQDDDLSALVSGGRSLLICGVLQAADNPRERPARVRPECSIIN